MLSHFVILITHHNTNTNAFNQFIKCETTCWRVPNHKLDLSESMLTIYTYLLNTVLLYTELFHVLNNHVFNPFATDSIQLCGSNMFSRYR